MKRVNSSLQTLYSQYHRETGRYGMGALLSIRGELFARWLGRGRRILDLGCRDGTLAHWYRDENLLVGTDIDVTALVQCRASLGIPAIVADLNRLLPYCDESFDAILLGEVLEHVIHPPTLIAECARLLRPGGLCIGSVPNSFHLLARLRYLVGRDPDANFLHLHQFSRSSLTALLSGPFRLREVRPIGGRYRLLYPSLLCWHFAWCCEKPGQQGLFR